LGDAATVLTSAGATAAATAATAAETAAAAASTAAGTAGTAAGTARTTALSDAAGTATAAQLTTANTALTTAIADVTAAAAGLTAARTALETAETNLTAEGETAAATAAAAAAIAVGLAESIATDAVAVLTTDKANAVTAQTEAEAAALAVDDLISVYDDIAALYAAFAVVINGYEYPEDVNADNILKGMIQALETYLTAMGVTPEDLKPTPVTPPTLLPGEAWGSKALKAPFLQTGETGWITVNTIEGINGAAAGFTYDRTKDTVTVRDFRTTAATDKVTATLMQNISQICIFDADTLTRINTISLGDFRSLMAEIGTTQNAVLSAAVVSNAGGLATILYVGLSNAAANYYLLKNPAANEPTGPSGVGYLVITSLSNTIFTYGNTPYRVVTAYDYHNMKSTDIALPHYFEPAVTTGDTVYLTSTIVYNGGTPYYVAQSSYYNNLDLSLSNLTGIVNGGIAYKVESGTYSTYAGVGSVVKTRGGVAHYNTTANVSFVELQLTVDAAGTVTGARRVIRADTTAGTAAGTTATLTFESLAYNSSVFGSMTYTPATTNKVSTGYYIVPVSSGGSFVIIYVSKVN
jgi:hypothetical protein